MMRPSSKAKQEVVKCSGVLALAGCRRMLACSHEESELMGEEFHRMSFLESVRAPCCMLPSIGSNYLELFYSTDTDCWIDQNYFGDYATA